MTEVSSTLSDLAAVDECAASLDAYDAVLFRIRSDDASIGPVSNLLFRGLQKAASFSAKVFVIGEGATGEKHTALQREVAKVGAENRTSCILHEDTTNESSKKNTISFHALSFRAPAWIHSRGVARRALGRKMTKAADDSSAGAAPLQPVAHHAAEFVGLPLLAALFRYDAEPSSSTAPTSDLVQLQPSPGMAEGAAPEEDHIFNHVPTPAGEARDEINPRQSIGWTESSASYLLSLAQWHHVQRLRNLEARYGMSCGETVPLAVDVVDLATNEKSDEKSREFRAVGSDRMRESAGGCKSHNYAPHYVRFLWRMLQDVMRDRGFGKPDLKLNSRIGILKFCGCQRKRGAGGEGGWGRRRGGREGVGGGA